MWGAIIGAGVGMASSLINGIKAGREKKKQQQMLERQRQEAKAQYDRDYYSRYLDSAAGRNLYNKVEESMTEGVRNARQAAAVAGGSEEAVLQARASANKALAETAGNIAAQDTAKKERAQQAYNTQLNSINNNEMAQSSATESGLSQASANAQGLIGQALMSFADGKSKDKDKE